MSEFVKIKPVRNIVTGSLFRIVSDDLATKATITSIKEDSLFTTELKEGDKVTFYNNYNARNLNTKTYTVDSITSASVFVAKEIVTIESDITKPNQNGELFKYAIKELDTEYNVYYDKRVLTSSIVGYKEDRIFSDLSLLDVDPNLVDIDEYNLISVATPIKFGGTSANEKDLKVLGHYTGNLASDYKVQIDGEGAAHVTTVTCVADVSGSLHRTGFIFYTPYAAVLVLIGINRADEGIHNSHSLSSTYGFKHTAYVYIDKGTSANDVCTAIFDALDDSDLTPDGIFTVSNKSSATFRITSAQKGKCRAPIVLPSMTATSTGISFTSADGASSFTDSNYESDGLNSTVWREYDFIEVKNSEKNDGVYQFQRRSDGTVIIKGEEFVEEEADKGYPVIIKNGIFESCGFSFSATVTGTNCTFKWSDTNGEIWNEETVAMLGMHHLNNEVRILFPTLTTFTSGDYWTFTFPKPNMIVTRNSIKELDNIYKCTEVC